MISQKNSFSKLLFVSALHIILLLFSFQTAIADDGKNKTSKNSKEWYYETIPPRRVDIFGDKFIQSEYIFKNTDKVVPCMENCPYKYPVWDNTIESVNMALSFIGLPLVKKLVEIEYKYGKKIRGEYTDPDYPVGKITIFKGKYFPHLWKIIIAFRKK
jgi:hypothetical protein